MRHGVIEHQALRAVKWKWGDQFDLGKRQAGTERERMGAQPVVLWAVGGEDWQAVKLERNWAAQALSPAECGSSLKAEGCYWEA